MAEYIKSKKGGLIAIVIRKKEKPKGVSFFTPLNFSQQVGLLKHKKGGMVKPHVHKLIERKVAVTQEVLHVRYGKIAVYLYDNSKKFIGTRFLTKGDTIILASAGHGIKVLRNSLILEVKQGPYLGKDDKRYIGR